MCARYEIVFEPKIDILVMSWDVGHCTPGRMEEYNGSSDWDQYFEWLENFFIINDDVGKKNKLSSCPS